MRVFSTDCSDCLSLLVHALHRLRDEVKAVCIVVTVVRRGSARGRTVAIQEAEATVACTSTSEGIKIKLYNKTTITTVSVYRTGHHG